MADWEHINPALIALFSRIAVNQIVGARPFLAQWKNGKRAQTSDKYKADVFLDVTTVANIGPDELRRETVRDDEGNPLYIRVTVCGPRRIVLRVEAISIDDTDTRSAWHIIERIRARLEWPTSVDALQDVQLSVAHILAATDTSFRADGRMRPRAMLDVVFVGVVNEVDPTEYPFVEQIEVEGHIADGETDIPIGPVLLPSETYALTDDAGAWLYSDSGALLIVG